MDVNKFLTNGGVELGASDYPDLRDFVMNNKKYDHIDKYKKMIEHEFPSMTINIFMHDEGSKPLIYKRFGVREGKTEEVNLLLQGDLKNWRSDNQVERSHVFLLLDVDMFFKTAFKSAGKRNENYTICRNCALCYGNYNNYLVKNNKVNIQYTTKSGFKGYEKEVEPIKVEDADGDDTEPIFNRL